MKTVSITLEDAEWSALERLARNRRTQAVDLARAILAGQMVEPPDLPSPAARRAVLDNLWDRIDACNVEVGERPTRTRSYDHRRFHRY